MTNATDYITNLILSGQWVPLLAFVLAIVNTLLSDQSSFKITLPVWARAAATIVIGQAITVLAAYSLHQQWRMLAIHGALAAFLAIVGSHAIFHDGAPGWLQAIAMIVQKLEAPAAADGAKPKPGGFVRMGVIYWLALLGIAGAATLTHCNATQAELHQTAQDASRLGGCIMGTIFGGTTDPALIAKDCVNAVPALIVDVIDDFLAKQPPLPEAGAVGINPQRALLLEARAKAKAAAGAP